MIRDIIIKAHYVASDELLKSGAIKITSPEVVKKILKPDLEKILDSDGYVNMEIIVEDTKVV